MLEVLRSAAGTWVAKLLLILLVVSFAVWGISGQMMSGPGGGTVLAAGDTRVSVVDYRLAYDRQVNQLSQQLGQRLTREQATMFGVDGQVLQQLKAGALLDEQARRLGLGVSREKIAQLTAEDPAFAGSGGQFDRQRFELVLRQVGMRPEDYLRNREQVAVRQQIVEAVSDGLTTPDTFLRAVALYEGESRTVDYLIVPQSAVGPVAPPADDVLAAWFETNKARYAAPEYRKIAYVNLEPKDIADPAAVTDEQVAEDYERNSRRYTTPERRAIDQLVFASEDAARAAVERIRGGESFDAVVAAEGKTAADVQLGSLAKEDIADAAVAEAAFALEAGAVSDVVPGAFGPVVVRVSEVTPAVVKPLADVAAQIREDIALNEAGSQVTNVHDSYEDARAAGETLEEAARKLNLKVVTVEAVDRNAQRPDGSVINDLPQSQQLLRAAFETEANVENPPLTVGSSGYVFYEVLAVTAPRDRTLDEVRDRVIADWTAEETTRLLSQKVSDLAKRLTDGEQIDTIATELGLAKQTRRGLRRDTEDSALGEGVAAIFAVAPNGAGTTQAPDETARILFKVTEVLEPAGASADSVAPERRAALASGLADDLLQQMVQRLETEFPVETFPAAVQNALTF